MVNKNSILSLALLYIARFQGVSLSPIASILPISVHPIPLVQGFGDLNLKNQLLPFSQYYSSVVTLQCSFRPPVEPSLQRQKKVFATYFLPVELFFCSAITDTCMIMGLASTCVYFFSSSFLMSVIYI